MAAREGRAHLLERRVARDRHARGDPLERAVGVLGARRADVEAQHPAARGHEPDAPVVRERELFVSPRMKGHRAPRERDLDRRGVGAARPLGQLLADHRLRIGGALHPHDEARAARRLERHRAVLCERLELRPDDEPVGRRAVDHEARRDALEAVRHHAEPWALGLLDRPRQAATAHGAGSQRDRTEERVGGVSRYSRLRDHEAQPVPIAHEVHGLHAPRPDRRRADARLAARRQAADGRVVRRLHDLRVAFVAALEERVGQSCVERPDALDEHDPRRPVRVLRREDRERAQRARSLRVDEEPRRARRA